MAFVVVVVGRVSRRRNLPCVLRGHGAFECPLAGVNRKHILGLRRTEFDPKRSFRYGALCTAIGRQ
jgi:hypothetical protein